MGPGKIKTILAILFLFAGRTYAQIGAEMTLVSPHGDIGQFFNKGISESLFFVIKDDDGPWRERCGLFYTQLSSRMDTVPVYETETGPTVFGGKGGTMVLPGYLVNREFTMCYVYIDLAYRLAHVKRFALYIGAGLCAGISHVQYDEGFETLLVSTSDEDLTIGGYRLTTDLEYKVSSHFQVLFEAVADRLTTNDWSTRYEHNTFGLGAQYFINPRKHKHRHSEWQNTPFHFWW